MKQVLAIIHPPVFGGPHNQVLQLNSHLASRGWNTSIVLPEEEGNGADRLKAAGLDVYQIPLHRLRAKINPKLQFAYLKGFLPEIASIRKLIREKEIDLIQVCGLMNPHGAFAAHQEDKPVVWQLLGTTAPMTLRFLLMPIVLKYADIIMTTGTRVARLHPGALRASDRLVIFFPPVDTQRFKPDIETRRRGRQDLGVPEDAILVGTVGNLNNLKGHDILVKAAGLLKDTSPHVYFRILGADTPTHAEYYQRKVIDEAQALGLLADHRLSWMDPGDRVADLLPAFDIFVLTSRAEGIPTVLLEAMACALPSVSKVVGSVDEIVDDQSTGFLVDSVIPQDFGNKIQVLIKNPELRNWMGQNARKKVIENFDVKLSADIHAKAYMTATIRHQEKMKTHRRYLQSKI